MFEILTDNHYDKIMDLFDSAKEEVVIVSPFLSMPMAKKLCNLVCDKSLKCKFVTRFYLEDMYTKANSIDAIEMMMKAGIKVYALKRLHTKLYLFDKKAGVVGSANFTSGGFKANVELSILASEEPILIEDLNKYANELIDFLENDDNGIVTDEVISIAREKYKTLIDNKTVKGVSYTNTYMYGADQEQKEMSTDALIEEVHSSVGTDVMQGIFAENVEKISYDHTIWLKFDGEGDNRINSEEIFPMIKVDYEGQEVYIQNYPYGVSSIHEGDEVYLAAITTDYTGRNQPVIVGRGIFREPIADGKVDDSWIKTISWMERFPYYCITDSVKILNTKVANGIRLSEVWDALGSNTYVSSFGKKETLIDVSKKHYQKAHIRLSGNAKVYLDKRLDELETKYGYTLFESQRTD